MAERIKALAASINADGNELEIVLTFDTNKGERRQVGYVYNGKDVERFAKELCYQIVRGGERAAMRLDAERKAQSDEPTDPGIVGGL